MKPKFRKSSYSSDSWNCVEVAISPAGALVRDSKDADGPVLRFPGAEWTAFLAWVKGGEGGN